ncbi:MAG TPA: hypothetical protein VMT54_19845 [Candidatus Cybelea sp.]|nr:hypothetical protein [Candidatus Cybelea sp.]
MRIETGRAGESMLIHLLSQAFNAYVTTAAGVQASVGPRVAGLTETFEISGMVTGLAAARSGDGVLITTAGNRYLRPHVADHRLTVEDNGGFSGNCEFRIVRSGGRTRDILRDGHAVALAVPVPFHHPRWVKIDSDGGLVLGDYSAKLPSYAALFIWQVPVGIGAVEPHGDVRRHDNAAVVAVPTIGAGEAGFDIVLDRPALQPNGSNVRVQLGGAAQNFLFSAGGWNSGMPRSNTPQTFHIPAGATRTAVFALGSIPRPDPIRLFLNVEIPQFQPPHDSLQALAAIDGFPLVEDANLPQIPSRAEAPFMAILTHSELAIAIEGQPLRNSQNGSDAIEQYGVMHSISDQPNGLRLTIRNLPGHPRDPAFDQELAVTAHYVNRADHPLPADPAAASGPVIAPGNGVVHFRPAADGSFRQDFQLTAFHVEKPQIVRVDIHLTALGPSPKPIFDLFAIEVLPPRV